MAYGIGSSAGGFFISSVVSDEVYDPVFDVPMDAEFIYQLIPSFFRDLMDDREMFSTVWSGLMQQVSGDLLNLWQIDYAKSLRDIPVIAQRKWVQLDLVREYDFSVDPELEFGGLGSALFLYEEGTPELACEFHNRARWDSGFVPLRGTVDERASLSFSLNLNISTAEKFSAALFGYSGGGEQLSNYFGMALLGSESADGAPRAALLHFDSNGLPTVSISAYTLSLGRDYRFNFSYTSGTGVAVLEFYELRYLRTSGSQGFTSGETGETLTNFFEATGVDFEALGVVAGDTLVALGSEYEILSVDGGLITTKVIGLPVNVVNISYEIRGEELVGSTSLDLPGDAANPSFSVKRFGVSTLDIRSTTSAIFSSLLTMKLKHLAATSWDWQFLDPASEDKIISIPRLQDKITSPTELLWEGTDYFLENSVLYFQEPPAEGLWAEYVGYDEDYIHENFGANVGIEALSSDQYKARVRGLYYAYWQGPTVSAIRKGVHLLVGLPIAEKAGAVESINTSFSGSMGLITVAGVDYLFPLAAGMSLVVGDEVKTFDPLCSGVEVVDYLSEPEWFVNLGINELRKFHSFSVRLNLDVFPLDTLALAADFVNRIKPTWKDTIYVVYKEAVDEFVVTDDLSIKLTLKLYDSPCELYIAYDSYEYEGDETDWRYDQSLVNWESTSGAMRGTAAALAGTVALTNGATGGTGTGTSFLSAIGGPGAVTDKYVGVALRTTGSGGVTVASSNLFNDGSGALAAVEVGDLIDITGEGVFEILAVNSTTQVVLDAPAAASNSGVAWSNTGKMKVWGQVASVASDTALTFSAAYTGVTGTYVMSLLDNEARRVFHDAFSEQCPDERLTLNITYVGAVVPFGPVTVPAATGTTTHTFTASPETYSVTLAELVP